MADQHLNAVRAKTKELSAAFPGQNFCYTVSRDKFRSVCARSFTLAATAICNNEAELASSAQIEGHLARARANVEATRTQAWDHEANANSHVTIIRS